MTLHVYDDLNKDSDALMHSLGKYGFASEHNYYYFISHEEKDCKLAFACFPENKGIMFLIWDDNIWQVISEVLSPEDERANLFLKFVRYAFDHGCKKILVEFDPKIRKSILKLLKNEELIKNEKHYTIKLGNIIARYKIPIISLKEWDPGLNGPEFSKIRKAKNRFFRNFDVGIISDAKINTVGYEELERLVHSWRKNRKNTDRAFYHSYNKFFENDFRGACATIILQLNGKTSGVASAIPIPASKHVYFHISLHDYSIPELGDFLNVLFFDKLKALGYDCVDFGASDEGLYNYKKKFRPVSSYEKECYYVGKKNKA